MIQVYFLFTCLNLYYSAYATWIVLFSVGIIIIILKLGSVYYGH